MKLIPLTQGKYAKVDDTDFEYLSQWKWRCSSNGYTNYAVRLGPRPKREHFSMHKELLSALGVDHKNGDGLDNQRKNLRYTTPSENLANRRTYKNNTSGYKGVSWHSRDKLWIAQASKEGKRYRIGKFETAKEASDQYLKKMKELYGEFASLEIYLA